MSEPAPPAPDPAPAPAPAPAPQAWYAGKIDDVTVGFWKNKGIDPADPVKVAQGLTEFYRRAEKFVGAPPEEILRIPKANADESDVKAYWGRIGVPAEAKDYDLSAVKLSDGTDLDQGFVDTVRSALLEGRVPRDRAAGIVQRLVKHMESNDAAELAEKTAIINKEKEALKRNWGTNEAANMVVAKAALERLGTAAGLSAAQIQQGWDAISAVGGIGASYAMEMLRVAGARMGEAQFITGGQGGGQQGNLAMSAAQAKAEIDALKQDSAFRTRLLAGDREANRRWNDLHQVYTAPMKQSAA